MPVKGTAITAKYGYNEYKMGNPLNISTVKLLSMCHTELVPHLTISTEARRGLLYFFTS